jgi:hypothetical protein
MYTEARAELRVAGRLAERADAEAVEGRLTALGRAARRYLPLGPSATARRELAELGRRQVPGAYEELRASVLATRWLITPDGELLNEAEQAIARRRATEQIAAGTVTLPDPERVATLARAEQALLARHVEPSRPLALLAVLGYALFLLGAWRALCAPARARSVLVAALGLILFVTGLYGA